MACTGDAFIEALVNKQISQKGNEFHVFVDKSLFIKELITDCSRAGLILYPHKFGKSVNFDMAARFLSADFEFKNGQMFPIYGLNDNRKYFNGQCFKQASENQQKYPHLKIYEDEQFVKNHFGRYPVLKLNFGLINGQNYSQFLQSTLNYVKKLYSKYIYIPLQFMISMICIHNHQHFQVLKSDYSVDLEQDYKDEQALKKVFFYLYSQMKPDQIAYVENFYKLFKQDKWSDSWLKDLVDVISAFYTKNKLIILVDSYDHPIFQMIEHYYTRDKNIKKDLSLTCRYLQTLFKDLYFWRGKESICKMYFTGFVSIFDVEQQFGLDEKNVHGMECSHFQYYGFTQQQVTSLVHRNFDRYFSDQRYILCEDQKKLNFSFENMMKIIEQKYKGYIANKTVIMYNPWSIANYLKEVYGNIVSQEDITFPKSYWYNSVQIRLIKHLLTQNWKISPFETIHRSSIGLSRFLRQFHQAMTADSYIQIMLCQQYSVCNFLKLIGYLTVNKDNFYRYPNNEIRIPLTRMIRGIKGCKLSNFEEVPYQHQCKQLMKCLHEPQVFAKQFEFLCSKQSEYIRQDALTKLLYYSLDYGKTQLGYFQKVILTSSVDIVGLPSCVIFDQRIENNYSFMIIQHTTVVLAELKNFEQVLEYVLWKIFFLDYLGSLANRDITKQWQYTEFIIRAVTSYRNRHSNQQPQPWCVAVKQYIFTIDQMNQIRQLFFEEHLKRIYDEHPERQKGDLRTIFYNSLRYKRLFLRSCSKRLGKPITNLDDLIKYSTQPLTQYMEIENISRMEVISNRGEQEARQEEMPEINPRQACGSPEWHDRLSRNRQKRNQDFRNDIRKDQKEKQIKQARQTANKVATKQEENEKKKEKNEREAQDKQ